MPWGALLSGDCMCVCVYECVEQLHMFCLAVLCVYVILAPCVLSATEMGFGTGFGWVFFFIASFKFVSFQDL